ncbi:MAG: MarR family transcriptional regulator [Aureibaculum sp.]|jgi:DNA-binding MarR family transcriptional regulator
MGNISKDINSSFPNERIKAMINIKYTANWLTSKEIRFLKPFGISPQQYNILRILKGAGEQVKVQVVKERMIERSPNATRLMDKLCEKGLIERVRCEEDRRVVFVEINKNGLGLLNKVKEFRENDFLNKVSVEEAKTLNELLDKIR